MWTTSASSKASLTNMSYESNFFYHPEKSGLKLLSFEDDSLSYEFDIIAFWVTEDGKIYTASDSGCSCPTPFEDFDSLESLERVGSLEQAEAVFTAWNKSYSGGPKAPPDSKKKLADWIKENAKF